MDKFQLFMVLWVGLFTVGFSVHLTRCYDQIGKLMDTLEEVNDIYCGQMTETIEFVDAVAKNTQLQFTDIRKKMGLNENDTIIFEELRRPELENSRDSGEERCPDRRDV